MYFGDGAVNDLDDWSNFLEVPDFMASFNCSQVRCCTALTLTIIDGAPGVHAGSFSQMAVPYPAVMHIAVSCRPEWPIISYTQCIGCFVSTTLSAARVFLSALTSRLKDR